jgi:hypothetical protein
MSNRLAASSERSQWSASVDKCELAYNSTRHSVTKHIPAVVLFSQICETIDEVPAEYRAIVQRELRGYASWEAMKVLVADQVKVRLRPYRSYN